jgi:hypothetical protein
MARTSDVTDPRYRAELTAAEELLDGGEYTDAVHRSVDVYLRLVTARPDLIIPVRRPELSVTTTGRPARTPYAPWPSTLGVVLDLSDGQAPQARFEKDRFIMSEAATYFEYALEAAVRAQQVTE